MATCSTMLVARINDCLWSHSLVGLREHAIASFRCYCNKENLVVWRRKLDEYFAFEALPTHRLATECPRAGITWKTCAPDLAIANSSEENLSIFLQRIWTFILACFCFGAKSGNNNRSKNAPCSNDCSRLHALAKQCPLVIASALTRAGRRAEVSMFASRQKR